MTMLYESYQAQDDLLGPWRSLAVAGGEVLRELPVWLLEWPVARVALAGAEMAPLTALRHTRRPFAIESVQVGGRQAAVHEDAVSGSSFGTLLRFAKTPHIDQPRVLLLAPLSGHFSTLLRDTVRTMLPDHDVFISDWHNCRDVPIEEGAFGVDEYVQHVIDFLRAMGPGGHLVAVCQPVVQALAATAVMAAAEDPCQPRSLTLMAGPIDARANPTAVNDLATSHPIEWFERNLIARVPARYPGAGRRVYPGFLQLAAFMRMNGSRHTTAFANLFTDLIAQKHAEAAKTEEFYREYFAVLDLAAEFYLETVQQVFQEHRLARGELCWRGQLVDPAAIRRTVLLTVEGERDDICGIGQTAAAQDLCNRIPLARRSHHLQVGVGHYGVFSGRRWERDVYPVVRNAILTGERRPRVAARQPGRTGVHARGASSRASRVG
jgi:poly(3-hydroxybutyrate) depolymerase